MVWSTILPVVCGWGDTRSVLVLHGIGSQYPSLIPEVEGGCQYSPPSLLMSRSPKPKYPSMLECSSYRRRCNLLFQISIQRTLDSWLQQGTFLTIDVTTYHQRQLFCEPSYYSHDHAIHSLSTSCLHLIIPCNLRDFLYFLLDCKYIQVIFVLFNTLFLKLKICL